MVDVYQFGKSEEPLVKLLQGRREEFVLTPKFTNESVPNAYRLVTGNNFSALVVDFRPGQIRRLDAMSSLLPVSSVLPPILGQIG